MRSLGVIWMPDLTHIKINLLKTIKHISTPPTLSCKNLIVPVCSPGKSLNKIQINKGKGILTRLQSTLRANQGEIKINQRERWARTRSLLRGNAAFPFLGLGGARVDTPPVSLPSSTSCSATSASVETAATTRDVPLRLRTPKHSGEYKLPYFLYLIPPRFSTREPGSSSLFGGLTERKLGLKPWLYAADDEWTSMRDEEATGAAIFLLRQGFRVTGGHQPFGSKMGESYPCVYP